MADESSPQPKKSAVVHFDVADPRRIVSKVRVGSPVFIDGGSGRKSARTDGPEYSAVWDTGATCTCAVPKIIRAAGLRQSGFRTFAGVGGPPRRRPMFPASIVMATAPDGPTLYFTEIAGLEDDGQLGGNDILIGMDIIGKGNTFLIRRPEGGLSLTFVVEGEQWQERQR